MEAFLVIIIAISLSMDAFSLSLAYGTIGIKKKQMISLSITVGIFHFFMPLIGMFIGETIFSIIRINPYIIVAIVLSIIGLDMIYESFKKEEITTNLNNIQQFFFAFAVSIDSLSLGLTLNTITNNYFFAIITFSLSSAIFTMMGLILGKKIKKLVGKISTILGGLALTIIGIIYII